jgi:competence protein ComEA
MTKRPVFRDSWKDYLAFSKRERRGIFALLFIIFIQICWLVYFNYFPSKEPASDFSAFEKEVDDMYASHGDSPDSGQASLLKAREEDDESLAEHHDSKPKELFAFNPNQLPEDDWRRLGFSDRQIKVIKNYESKGGKFYSKENLKKMYCISEEEYNRIEPYIMIPEKKYEYSDSARKKFERIPVMVDIGTADSAEMTKLRGIGPGFARRITAYRTRLGGFRTQEQLLEVWGFSDSLYQLIRSQICLKDSLNIQKINLNTADFNALRIHPYIGYQLAGIVCNYRKQHNGFKTAEEIRKIPLVNDQLYSKLAPYLKVE